METNNIYVHVDHNGQDIINYSIERVTDHPSGTGLYEGREWIRTSDNRKYRYNGTSIVMMTEEPDLKSIYTHDDTLTTDRRVNLGTNDLTFAKADDTNIVTILEDGDVVIGGSTPLEFEEISLQGKTVVQGTTTAGNSTLAIYDGASTPVKTAEFFDDGKFAINSTTNGFLMPRMTEVEMEAISSPDLHLLVFNTTVNQIYRFNGSVWVGISSSYGITSINDSTGTPAFYATLPSAFTAASDGDVINLHSNITATSSSTMPGASDATLTINGNGHTITHTSFPSADPLSEFALIKSGTGDKVLYLNDVNIVSNGAGVSSSSGVIVSELGTGTISAKANSGTYVSSINGVVGYRADITGGTWTSTEGYANFEGTTIKATVTTKNGKGSFINCDITVNSGGQIGLDGNLIDCTITGDATGGQSMIYSKVNNKIHGCTITCTSGANSAIRYAGGVMWTTANPTPLKDTKVYYYGTNVYAVSAQYIASIKDVYIYSENTTALYAQNTFQTGGYNLENVVLETNSTNKAAFYRLDSGNFRMKNVSATNWNSTNTKEAFDIRVTLDSELYMENCTANINNPAVDNVSLINNNVSTGGAYIYGLTMSKIGTGLNLNTVPLLNVNTTDAYGNLQIG